MLDRINDFGRETDKKANNNPNSKENLNDF